MKEFVHLHLHSQYSLLDGAIKIPNLVARVKELSMSAVAVTDHGAMIGAIEFYEAAREAGVRPILGSEIYLAPGSMSERRNAPGEDRAYHLILLAETDEGYRNLVRIVSAAHRDGFYYRPRADKELLRRHSAGLIATSACLQGELAVALMQEGEGRASELLEEYKEIFGDGRFFVEIQANGLKEQDRANEKLVRLARRTGTPLVATNDCHYLDREDAKVHEVLLCLQTGKTLSSEGRMRFGSDEFYVKSPDEFFAAFGHAAPEALTNTLAIAERCNVTLDLKSHKIPEFRKTGGRSPEEFLKGLAADGLEARFREMGGRGFALSPQREEEYRARLRSELDVIAKTGFAGYFLIVWDFMKFARDAGIPVGPGRGSAAGSLAAYALRITEIDPIRYGLLFERFLNPERISLPDVDCDFCKNRREEVIDYVKREYGEENVSQIITFGTMKARAAVRDVGRVLDMPYADVDRIAKLIPGELEMTLEKALEVEPALPAMVRDDPRVAELFRYAAGIEGLCRHASTHAAGVVIANRPITEYVPLYRNSNGDITTQFTMEDVEKAGLVKFDFLGLKTLTAIHDALALIRATRGEEIAVDALPLDDAPTYERLRRGDTPGVFQAESSGFTGWLVRVAPDRIEHLVAMVALYRPGPLQSGMAEDFVERRHGRKRVEYMLPQLEEILRETYGVILYQEQVMQIAKSLANFTMGEADVLRKAMGKKKKELIDAQKEVFLRGAKDNGVPADKAEAIFDQMAHFAGYGFNKSHSAAYAMLMYQTSYLKAHYRVEFMSALMTSESGDTDKIIRYIAYCKEEGIAILPPDVNESESGFHPAGGAIRFGLSAIKGVGESAVETILHARAEEPFGSLDDFLARVDLRRINRKVVECLIKAGAFDSLDPDRGRLFEGLSGAIEAAQKEARRRESGQYGLFGQRPAPPPPARSRGDAPPPLWSRRERLAAEKEALGFYITGHPLDSYAAELEMFATMTTVRIPDLKQKTDVRIAGIVTNLKERTTRKGRKMATMFLEDLEGTVEVVVFADAYRENAEALATDEPVFVVGRVEPDDKAARVLASEILPIAGVRERLARSVHFQILCDRMSAEDIADLKRIIARHGGDKKGYFHFVRPGEYETVVALPDRIGVASSLEMARALRQRFGYDVMRLR